MMAAAARRGWLWPIGLAALLVVSAGVNVVFMIIANRDPSFAVEPDYYRKALAWDETMAQEARNRALGWALDVRAEPASQRGRLRLVIRLADSAGSALDGAAVTVEALHGARAADVLTGTLAPAGPGLYAAEMPLRRAGLWELRFRAARGDDVFTRRLSTDLPGAP